MNYQRIISYFVLFVMFLLAFSKVSFAQELRSRADLFPPPFVTGCSEAEEVCFKNGFEGKDFLTTIENLVQDYCLDVPVLLYHHIQPYEIARKQGHEMLTVDNLAFEKHLKYLNDNKYTTLTALELIEALRNKETLPKKSILLTLDDGYDDNFSYAFPLAQKYNAHLNLMIPPSLIGKPGYMSWENLSTMQSSGLVSIYNHTYSHFPLSQGDKARIELEVMLGDYFLQLNLGNTTRILTYPYGSFDAKTIDILKKNDFIGAFTTQHSHTQCLSQIYMLHRDHVGNASLEAYGL